MTFEEWWESVATQDTWVEKLCREAFQAGYNKGYSVSFTESEEVYEAGWAEGLIEGYSAGYKDNGLCPNCLEEKG